MLGCSCAMAASQACRQLAHEDRVPFCLFSILLLYYSASLDMQGNILDDEVLINTLSESKATSNTIAAKVAEAETTEKQIDEAREMYRPVAARASLLFFCISDLAAIDPMYQYSLAWFSALFVRSMQDAPAAADVAARGAALNHFFTFSLFSNVCRSLFEQHKLLLSLLLCVKILAARGEIDPAEWRALLAGPMKTDFGPQATNPAPEWLTGKAWLEVLNVGELPAFAGFADVFREHIGMFKVWTLCAWPVVPPGYHSAHQRSARHPNCAQS